MATTVYIVARIRSRLRGLLPGFDPANGERRTTQPRTKSMVFDFAQANLTLINSDGYARADLLPVTRLVM